MTDFDKLSKTIKGKGVSFIENMDGWHGKPLLKAQTELANMGIKTVVLDCYSVKP